MRLGCRFASALGVVLMMALAASAAAQQADSTAAQPDLLIKERTKGSATAPVTVYEMSDFQCPFCRQHALETFPALERRFIQTGKVRWVFINFPLTSLHPNAAAAAEFAMCAARAGKFWPVHDLLFQYQKLWAPLKNPAPFLVTLADSVGLPRQEILPCLDAAQTRPIVAGDAAEASRAGVGSTPTFYIEGGLLRGAVPTEIFTRILDSIWTAKTARP